MQTSEDKYNACTTKPSTATNTCAVYAGAPNTADDGTFTANSDGANLNWKNPLADDAASDPFCTAYSTDPAAVFTCKKIKCITQRRLNTGDKFDFSFSPTSETVFDKMVIRPGRALLGLNTAGCTATTCQSTFDPSKSANIEINVYQMASTLQASLIGAAVGAALLAF